MQSTLLRNITLASAVLALAACSSGPSSRIDYKEAQSLPSLETPPDLSSPMDADRARLPQGVQAPQQQQQQATVSTPAARRVLPVIEGIQVERDRSTRWLVIDSEADRLWPRLRDFWQTIGLELARDDAQLGIMETEWAENRADAPGGFLTGLVRSVFQNAYSANTRDKYRLRLEPREDGRTEVFVSHYGLKEVVTSQSSEFVDTAWTVRPTDPELVHEILNRIIVHLGGSREQAVRALQSASISEQPARTRLVADTLIVDEPFNRTWRRAGIALDEIGLIVEDRNLSDGIYFVTDFDPLADSRASRGWLRSLFRRSGDEEVKRQWQVVLAGDQQATRIMVRDGDGGELPREEARAILEKLEEQLR